MASLSRSCPRYLVWDFAYFSLGMSIQLFFVPILFSDYSCSVDACHVCIVSSGCNQFSFFKVVNAIFNSSVSTQSLIQASRLPPSFLYTYTQSTSSLECKALCILMGFLVLCSICWRSSLVHFMNGHEDQNPSEYCGSHVVYWPPKTAEVHIPMASYGKRSRRRAWLIIWYRVKIPQYSHKLMHRKRVTCELHDSYFRSMTIKHAIPKTAGVHIPMASYREISSWRWTII